MFSGNLTNQIIAYFKNRFGDEISVLEAEEYLDSLADLYLVFADMGSVERSVFPPPRRGEEKHLTR